MCYLLENFFRETQQYVRVLLRLVAKMGGKVLRTTRGISGGGVPPWPAANFHLRYRYGENFLCPGNVEQSRLKAAALPHVKLIFPESPL